MYKKSSGFTLVELLVVIIIIGILSGMVLLSVGSATDKAEATKIVNALRNYKTASLMYYADCSEWPSNVGDWTESLDRYVDRSMDKTCFNRIVIENTGNRWLIGIKSATGSPMEQMGVQLKLSMQARSSALYNSDGTLFYNNTGGSVTIYTNMR